jgi:hypothetical protein
VNAIHLTQNLSKATLDAARKEDLRKIEVLLFRTAVLAAYRFNPKKDLLAQLLALNQQVASRIEKGEPVTAPGLPKNYPDARKLVTIDCIQPGSTYPPYEPPNPKPLVKPNPDQAAADAAHFYSAKEEPPPYG